MKTTLAAIGFTLIAALSGFSTAQAAGFNDRSAIPNALASVSGGRQDLRHVRLVQGFNQQSHISAAALQSTAHTSGAPILAGVHCELAPRVGFQNSTSIASC